MARCKKFEMAELDECTELFLRVFSVEPWNDQWKSFEDAKRYLKEFIDNPVFEGFVIYEGVKIVGVCFGHKRSWWREREFYIDEMFVDNETQGKGIGTILFDSIKENMLKEGIKKFALITGAGIPAEKFYEKQGLRRSKSIIFMTQDN